jgi:hypothetical protein
MSAGEWGTIVSAVVAVAALAHSIWTRRGAAQATLAAGNAELRAEVDAAAGRRFSRVLTSAHSSFELALTGGGGTDQCVKDSGDKLSACTPVNP